MRSLVGTGAVVAVALFGASLLPETAILTVTNVPVEPIALVIALPLAYLGLQIIASRDARRFVVGFGVAAVAWFAILYPNISALPLPSAVVAAYQGILPTYLYAFQFPVSTVTRESDTPLVHADAGAPARGADADLPRGRLLGLGLEAGAGRVGSRRAGAGTSGRRRGPRPERRRLRYGARKSAGSEPLAASRRMTKP